MRGAMCGATALLLVAAVVGAAPSEARSEGGPPRAAGHAAPRAAVGAEDVAIGIPTDDVDGVADAGSVVVVPAQYGDGVDPSAATTITRADLGGTARPGDRFGAAVAISDDGGTRVVIGAPGADSGAGRVYVLDADPETGELDVAHPTVLRQGRDGLPGTPEPGDAFGASLVVGGSGWLAIGAPGEDVHDVADAGAVTAVPLGTLRPLAKVLYQGGGDVPGVAEPGDRFGTTVSRFGNELLLVGAPFEDVQTVIDAGGVTSIDLGDRRPAVAYRQGTRGVPGVPERGDEFGAAMTVVDGGALIGVPREDISGLVDVGIVVELPSPDRLGGAPISNRIWRQGLDGLEGVPEPGDRFGAALSYGGPGLVIGAPGEDVGDIRDAGAAHILPFVTDSDTIFSTEVDVQIRQGSPGIPGVPEAGDRFGSAVGRAASCCALIGAPAEDLGGVVGAGVMLFTPFEGIDPTPTSEITSADVGAAAEAGDGFGRVLTGR